MPRSEDNSSNADVQEPPLSPMEEEEKTVMEKISATVLSAAQDNNCGSLLTDAEKDYQLLFYVVDLPDSRSPYCTLCCDSTVNAPSGWASWTYSHACGGRCTNARLLRLHPRFAAPTSSGGKGIFKNGIVQQIIKNLEYRQAAIAKAASRLPQGISRNLPEEDPDMFTMHTILEAASAGPHKKLPRLHPFFTVREYTEDWRRAAADVSSDLAFLLCRSFSAIRADFLPNGKCVDGSEAKLSLDAKASQEQAAARVLLRLRPWVDWSCEEREESDSVQEVKMREMSDRDAVLNASASPQRQDPAVPQDGATKKMELQVARNKPVGVLNNSTAKEQNTTSRTNRTASVTGNISVSVDMLTNMRPREGKFGVRETAPAASSCNVTLPQSQGGDDMPHDDEVKKRRRGPAKKAKAGASSSKLPLGTNSKSDETEVEEVLQLVLEMGPFEVMATGEKKVEYRDWKDRNHALFISKENRAAENFSTFRKFKRVRFRNGYQSEPPTFEVEFKEIRESEKAVDAEFSNGLHVKIGEGVKHYEIDLGKVLKVENYGAERQERIRAETQKKYRGVPLPAKFKKTMKKSKKDAAKSSKVPQSSSASARQSIKGSPAAKPEAKPPQAAERGHAPAHEVVGSSFRVGNADSVDLPGAAHGADKEDVDGQSQCEDDGMLLEDDVEASERSSRSLDDEDVAASEADDGEASVPDEGVDSSMKHELSPEGSRPLPSHLQHNDKALAASSSEAESKNAAGQLQDQEIYIVGEGGGDREVHDHCSAGGIHEVEQMTWSSTCRSHDQKQVPEDPDRSPLEDRNDYKYEYDTGSAVPVPNSNPDDNIDMFGAADATATTPGTATGGTLAVEAAGETRTSAAAAPFAFLGAPGPQRRAYEEYIRDLEAFRAVEPPMPPRGPGPSSTADAPGAGNASDSGKKKMELQVAEKPPAPPTATPAGTAAVVDPQEEQKELAAAEKGTKSKAGSTSDHVPASEGKHVEVQADTEKSLAPGAARDKETIAGEQASDEFFVPKEMTQDEVWSDNGAADRPRSTAGTHDRYDHNVDDSPIAQEEHEQHNPANKIDDDNEEANKLEDDFAALSAELQSSNGGGSSSSSSIVGSNKSGRKAGKNIKTTGTTTTKVAAKRTTGKMTIKSLQEGGDGAPGPKAKAAVVREEPRKMMNKVSLHEPAKVAPGRPATELGKTSNAPALDHLNVNVVATALHLQSGQEGGLVSGRADPVALEEEAQQAEGPARSSRTSTGQLGQPLLSSGDAPPAGVVLANRSEVEQDKALNAVATTVNERQTENEFLRDVAKIDPAGENIDENGAEDAVEDEETEEAFLWATYGQLFPEGPNFVPEHNPDMFGPLVYEYDPDRDSEEERLEIELVHAIELEMEREEREKEEKQREQEMTTSR
ncbi:unnamed protein product [Amoebophrya sp. A120]|nr:unnamed protein product [Amoebophrya sp. A120]|eukprot:GSA120T00024400001.1